MDDDDILQQVRAAREAFAAAHDFDIRKMSAFLDACEKAEGRTVVSLPPRPPLYVAVAPSPAEAEIPSSATPKHRFIDIN